MHLSSRDLEALVRSLRGLYACRAPDAVLEHSLRIVETIGLARKRRDFTKRDRTMLNLISPHIKQAHANAQAFAMLHRGPSGVVSGIPGLDELSARESEVAFWLAEGKSNVEIAVILAISPRTAEKHVEHVLQKLGVDNRFAAAVLLRHADRGPDDPRPVKPTT